MTGSELKQWREAQGKTQRELAEALDISQAALTRWENGQEIPGPAKKLLALLIDGVQPFESRGPANDSSREAEHFWKLRLTLEDWHRLEALAKRQGYSQVRDYLLFVLKTHLQKDSIERAKLERSLTDATANQPEEFNTPDSVADSV